MSHNIENKGEEHNRKNNFICRMKAIPWVQLLFLFALASIALNNTSFKASNAILLATLFDIPLLLTLYFAISTRSPFRLLAKILFCTSIFYGFFVPVETVLIACLAQTASGLYLHRAIAFFRKSPLLAEKDNRLSGNQKARISSTEWVWGKRVTSLINKLALRLDRFSLPIFLLLAGSLYEPQFVIVSFAAFAFIWAIFLFDFVLPLMLLEFFLRYIFLAFKNDVPNRIIRSILDIYNSFFDKVKHSHVELKKSKSSEQMTQWFLDGFSLKKSSAQDIPETSEGENNNQERKERRSLIIYFFVFSILFAAFLRYYFPREYARAIIAGNIEGTLRKQNLLLNPLKKKQPTEEVQSQKQSAEALRFSKIKSPDVDVPACNQTGDKCITSYQALRDIYNHKGVVYYNVALLKDTKVATVTHSFTVQRNGKLFAVFLTQLNTLNNGSIDAYHAASAPLGMAVYEFKDNWQLMKAVSHVVNMGSWGNSFSGELLLQEKQASYYVSKDTHFYILLSNSYLGQGYYSDDIEVIKITYAPTHQIEWLGHIPARESNGNCGGDTSNPDWHVTDIILTDSSQSPVIVYTKHETKACTSNPPPTISSTVSYLYHPIQKKFLKTSTYLDELEARQPTY
ncbi:MAG: hypothetical protein AB7S81_03555 [Bdellovibrionales bacterium]